MESKDDLTGSLARLPDGQLVRIETVYRDGYATARRVDGEREGQIAYCAIEKLEPIAHDKGVS
jgi:hypothetical protein